MSLCRSTVARWTSSVLAASALLVAPVVTFGSVAQAAPAPATTIGSQYGGFAPDGDFGWLPDAELDRQMDAMKASGARWVRLGVVWSVIERQRGVYDWSTSDRVISAARSRGMNVLGLLTYAPEWASGSGNDKVPPRNPADISGVAAAATARYAPQGVHAWEIWNEPNISNAWAPKPDVDVYAQLLNASSRAIRSVDPAATVVTGGLSPAQDAGDGTTVAPLTFVKGLYAAGAGPSFQALGMHPYAFPAMPMQAGTESWNSFVRAPALHELMTANGDAAKKIWFTEFGAPTGTSSQAVDAATQAAGVRQAYEQLPKWSWAGPMFYYAMKDSGTDSGDREQNFGLIRKDWSVKPAWTEFGAVMGGTVAAPVPPRVPTGTWLSDRAPGTEINGHGPVERDLTNGEGGAGDGRTLSLRGKTFPKGLGVHSDSWVSYSLPAGTSTFSATVGVDDEAGGRGSVVFRVVGDGKQLWASPKLTGSSAALPVSVDVRGVKVLRLVVRDAQDGTAYDHADWAMASIR